MSDDFAAHIEGACTTLCHCWRLVRRDGTTLGFTDHDLPLTFDDQLYEPETGFTRSEAARSLGLAVDATDVEGALSSERITDADIEAGLYDGAAVTAHLVDWRDTRQRRALASTVIGKITRADGRFVAELESVARSLDRPNGRYLRRQCDAELGDARCKAELNGPQFNGSGAVVAVQAPGTYLVDGLGAFAAGWFAGGRLTWTGGALDGRAMWVAGHSIQTGGVVVAVAADMPPAEAGDSFDIVAGCDKSFSTCKAKFANAENFRGFPHLPGNDAAYAYVTEGIEFDGGVLVE